MASWKYMFPNAITHNAGYSLTIWVEEASVSHADIYVQATSSGTWDWWLSSSAPPLKIYVDGEVANNCGIDSLNQLHLPGNDLNGVTNSDKMKVVSNIPITHASTLRVYVDCSSKPVIEGSWSPGLLDTGDMTGKFDSVSVEVPPTISNIRNTNPRNGKTNVSNEMNLISLSFEKSENATWTAYGFGDRWREIPDVGTSFTVTEDKDGEKLMWGTTYHIEAVAWNYEGYSNTLSMDIRTRYNPPTFTANVSDIQYEDLTLSWTSNRNLKQVSYSFDNKNWTYLNVANGAKSGSFKLTGLTPNTKYNIWVAGLTTEEWDSVWSSNIKLDTGTVGRTEVIGVGPITFGLDIPINIKKPTNDPHNLEVFVKSKSSTDLIPLFNVTTLSDGKQNLAPTQNHWDTIYRNYPNANDIQMYFKITTTRTGKDYLSEKSGTCSLTGIAKTVHTGSDKGARRAQVFIGDGNRAVKRAVTWAGDNGTPRRTI